MSLLQVHNSRYRKAKQIPNDISKHCDIFFDEALFINALNLLNSILTIGAARPNSVQETAFVPLAFHIELASVLLINPRYTNQACDEEDSEIASRSIIFLRNIFEILGPINANLIESFSFRPLTRNNEPSPKNNHAIVDIDDYLDEFSSSFKRNRIKSFIANKGRTRRCAKDFWHVVGWSFNCSIRYPHRWKYLKLWLEYMIDVMHADLMERGLKITDLSINNTLVENLKVGSRPKSIISSYLSDINGNSTAARRVIKSIFADGSTESLRIFPEVFPNETKMRKSHDGQELRKQHLNSYYTKNLPEDDLDETDLIDCDSILNFRKDEDCSEEYWMGGIEAVTLRQRLITLLSDAARVYQNDFIMCKDLYALMYDYIYPLPIPIFTCFMTSSKSSGISEVVYTPLCQMLLSRLLPKSAPSPSENHLQATEFSQTTLQKFYLPFTALTSSYRDNAKVSILVENLLRLLLKNHACHYTPDLEMAVENGIVAREEKTQKQKKRRQNTTANPSVDSDAMWLKNSSIRLRSLISWLKLPSKKNL